MKSFDVIKVYSTKKLVGKQSEEQATFNYANIEEAFDALDDIYRAISYSYKDRMLHKIGKKLV